MGDLSRGALRLSALPPYRAFDIRLSRVWHKLQQCLTQEFQSRHFHLRCVTDWLRQEPLLATSENAGQDLRSKESCDVQF